MTHPRALTVPLEQQNPRVRRNRARQRAMIHLARDYPDLYRTYYWQELQKVGLE